MGTYGNAVVAVVQAVRPSISGMFVQNSQVNVRLLQQLQRFPPLAAVKQFDHFAWHQTQHQLNNRVVVYHR
jgi:hypothetical protein